MPADEDAVSIEGIHVKDPSAVPGVFVKVMDPGDVRITHREVYNEVVAIKEAIIPVVSAVPDHEKRIRRIEKWMYGVPATLLGSIIALVLSLKK